MLLKAVCLGTCSQAFSVKLNHMQCKYYKASKTHTEDCRHYLTIIIHCLNILLGHSLIENHLCTINSTSPSLHLFQVFRKQDILSTSFIVIIDSANIQRTAGSCWQISRLQDHNIQLRCYLFWLKDFSTHLKTDMM